MSCVGALFFLFREGKKAGTQSRLSNLLKVSQLEFSLC